MPVKSSTSSSISCASDISLRLEDYIDDDMVAVKSEVVDEIDDLYTIQPPLLSDDIWNKFELDIIAQIGDDDMDNIFSDFEVDSFKLSSIFGDDLCEIRNHDCMWAGHCGSKEHPADQEHKHQPHIIIPPHKPPLSKPPIIPPGRSLLLKTQPQLNTPPTHLTNPPIVATTKSNMLPPPPIGPLVPSPESPPMSDDEEVKGKTTLQLLHDAISECEIEDDSDLYEYLEDDADPEELLSDAIKEETSSSPLPPQSPTSPAMAQPAMQRPVHTTPFNSDHCYHKDKNASMRNLGIETPSDSEEEIDVVSIGEKQSTLSKGGPGLLCSTLPNNPSIRDKQQLQRTMASAMSKNGIKTLLPRKASTVVSSSSSSGEATTMVRSPVKGRRPGMDGGSRGMKRTKQRTHSPYKKRIVPNCSYNGGQGTASSDSDEPEPSEKRSLHNNMERQRRIDLRNAFEDLRLLVPEVSKRDKAAKVVILREAANYCDYLGDHSDNMHRQVNELRMQQEHLRSRVSQLRRSLAAKHR